MWSAMTPYLKAITSKTVPLFTKLSFCSDVKRNVLRIIISVFIRYLSDGKNEKSDDTHTWGDQVFNKRLISVEEIFILSLKQLNCASYLAEYL